MNRRKFVSALAMAGLASHLPRAWASNAGRGSANAAAQLPRISSPGQLKGQMLYRKLGSTGEQVSAIGLGGAHIGMATVSESDSIRLIHAALDRGINFLDNSWDYNGGQSEMRMGRALAQAGYRNKAFLMTKLDGRTKESAAKQIDESLGRLQTDHLDLLQHHEIIRFDDADRIFANGGAMEAVLEAKKAGKVRYIGFTGHKDPRIHLYMLDTAARHGFRFDTVQMPLNVMDAHFRSFAHLVLPRLVRENIGVLGMKSIGDGIILKSGTVSAIECLHFALNLPTSVVITGIDSDRVLEQAFQAVQGFRLMDQRQLAALLARTQAAAANGEFELFKTTSHFDATAQHPEWLGGETPQIKQLIPKKAS
jgi:uncharacterized protein